MVIVVNKWWWHENIVQSDGSLDKTVVLKWWNGGDLDCGSGGGGRSSISSTTICVHFCIIEWCRNYMIYTTEIRFCIKLNFSHILNFSCLETLLQYLAAKQLCWLKL
jgi:hypothetical protein